MYIVISISSFWDASFWQPLPMPFAQVSLPLPWWCLLRSFLALFCLAPSSITLLNSLQQPWFSIVSGKPIQNVTGLSCGRLILTVQRYSCGLWSLWMHCWWLVLYLVEVLEAKAILSFRLFADNRSCLNLQKETSVRSITKILRCALTIWWYIVLNWFCHPQIHPNTVKLDTPKKEKQIQ